MYNQHNQHKYFIHLLVNIRYQCHEVNSQSYLYVCIVIHRYTCTYSSVNWHMYVDRFSLHTFVACMQDAGKAQVWCPQKLFKFATIAIHLSHKTLHMTCIMLHHAKQSTWVTQHEQVASAPAWPQILDRIGLGYVCTSRLKLSSNHTI
jgi:hypothetical protein